MTQAIIAQAVTSDSKQGTVAAREVAVTRETSVRGRIEDVFHFVAAEGVLTEILTGYDGAYCRVHVGRLWPMGSAWL